MNTLFPRHVFACHVVSDTISQGYDLYFEGKAKFLGQVCLGISIGAGKEQNCGILKSGSNICHQEVDNGISFELKFFIFIRLSIWKIRSVVKLHMLTKCPISANSAKLFFSYLEGLERNREIVITSDGSGRRV